MEKNKRGDIICFADDWGRHPSSTQHIMRVLSKDFTILYVESLGFRKPGVSSKDFSRIFTKLKNFWGGIKEKEKNIFVLTPLVIPLHKYSLVRTINRFILDWQISSYLRKNRIKKFILWFSHPSAEPVAKRWGEKKIYYCADEYSEYPGYSKKVVMELEQSLLSKVDAVLVVSDKLCQSKSRYNRNIFLMPHGVEFKHFSKIRLNSVELPQDMRDIKKPIIGFYGSIHEWIDFELLQKISQNVDWSLVLIGPVITDISLIQGKKNVHFLGDKDYKLLPFYLKGFDVCIIPYKLTEYIVNVRPLKLFEYMASGKPIVSTPLPTVLPYKELVRIGYTQEKFIQQIEKSLEEKDESLIRKRIDLAQENSWENLVEKNLKKLLFT